MAKPRTLQYTIRNVPSHVDEVLRRRARNQAQTFNQVALDALIAGADAKRQFDDLDFLIGTLSSSQAKHLDEEIAVQRRVDPGLWK